MLPSFHPYLSGLVLVLVFPCATSANPKRLVRDESNSATKSIVRGASGSAKIIEPNAAIENYRDITRTTAEQKGDRNGDEGLTLVVMDYSRHRWEDLHFVLRHYQSFDRSLIAEIVVVWNDAKDFQAVQDLQHMNQTNEKNKVPIRVEVYGKNSMNNRFDVGKRIRTQGVVLQDNDMYVDQSDLHCLVSAWRRQPSRLFGAWSERRSHKMVTDGKYKYVVDAGTSFSMLVPHPFVVKTDYLRLYLEHKTMLDLVDRMMNCDDIYFNALVAHETGQSPIAYDIDVHWQKSSHWGMSMNGKQWAGARDQCVQQISDYFMRLRSQGVQADLNVFPWATCQSQCPQKLHLKDMHIAMPAALPPVCQ